MSKVIAKVGQWRCTSGHLCQLAGYQKLGFYLAQRLGDRGPVLAEDYISKGSFQVLEKQLQELHIRVKGMMGGRIPNCKLILENERVVGTYPGVGQLSQTGTLGCERGGLGPS